MLDTKKCKQCGKKKPLLDFPRNGSYYKNKCKHCYLEYLREYRARSSVIKRMKEKRETVEYRNQRRKSAQKAWLVTKEDNVKLQKRQQYYRRYFRDKYATDKEYCHNKKEASRGRDIKDYDKMRRSRDAVKIYARKRLHYMVRKGVIVKPATCEICHEKTAVQGHHEDYERPLDVKWLCTSCHGKTSRKDMS